MEKFLEPLPSNVGKESITRDPVNGQKTVLIIEDEIRHTQHNSPDKTLVLQKLRYQGSGETELRLAYYILGKRPRMKGKWTWGQFATFLPIIDFQSLIDKAKQKGWID